MSTPSRFTSGVATVARGMPLADLPFPDPFRSGGSASKGVCVYATDFTELAASEFTVTGASSTFALAADTLGGAGLLTPGAATTASSAYKVPSAFQFVSGYKMWFVARFQVSAVAGNVAYKVGLQKGSATTDGIWFTKAAATTTISLVSAVDNTATTVVASVGTAVLATDVEVGFYYNGVDVLAYADGVLVGRMTAPDIGATGTDLTNELLCPFVQITPTATDTLTVDYMMVAQEISR